MIVACTWRVITLVFTYLIERDLQYINILIYFQGWDGVQSSCYQINLSFRQQCG